MGKIHKIQARGAIGLVVLLSGCLESVPVTQKEDALASGTSGSVIPSTPTGNRAPIANAGADIQIQAPTSSARLMGSGSDPDRNSITYLWSKTAGGTAVFSSTVVAQPTVSGLAPGTYTFQLKVTDSNRASATDSVRVVVLSSTTSTPKVTDLTPGKVHLWRRWGVAPNDKNYDSGVFLPKDYATTTKLYPLILSLHGIGGHILTTDHTDLVAAGGANREGFIRQVWDKPLAETFPGIVIAPDARMPGQTANAWWNAAELRELIIAATARYRVDPKRIVVTGLSAGGRGTEDVAMTSKDIIAGAMPGAFNADAFAANPCAIADLPIWSFGNQPDTIFNPASWTALEPRVKSCANYTGDFTLTIYQTTCAHGCWDAHWAKPEVQQWLLNQSK